MLVQLKWYNHNISPFVDLADFYFSLAILRLELVNTVPCYYWWKSFLCLSVFSWFKLNMGEFWLISAPGEKTCQETFDRMNRVTSVDNKLSVNHKFSVPDLKVGTLDQLVGLSDELTKLDSYSERFIIWEWFLKKKAMVLFHVLFSASPESLLLIFRKFSKMREINYGKNYKLTEVKYTSFFLNEPVNENVWAFVFFRRYNHLFDKIQLGVREISSEAIAS